MGLTDQEYAERDRKDAAAYREMETDIHNLAHMGRITAKMVSAAEGTDVNGSEHGAAFFAVHHLREMIDRFEDMYEQGDWRPGGSDGAEE